jgi:hypothetical protein
VIALLIAVAVVAVERYVNRRRLALHEALADVGWLALLFAFIEFAYLMFVEALTLNYGALARPLWYTEWWALKDLLLSVATAVMLILTSAWMESAGIRVELRRPRATAVARGAAVRQSPPKSQRDKACDIEWREAS